MAEIANGLAVGIAAAMALGIFPPHNSSGDHITPQDRARAKEVEDRCDDNLPPGAVLIKCSEITVTVPAKRKSRT